MHNDPIVTKSRSSSSPWLLVGSTPSCVTNVHSASRCARMSAHEPDSRSMSAAAPRSSSRSMSRWTGASHNCSSCRVNRPSLKPCQYSNMSAVSCSNSRPIAPAGPARSEKATNLRSKCAWQICRSAITQKPKTVARSLTRMPRRGPNIGTMVSRQPSAKI